MTYQEFERVFGRARVLKGLPPYTESDVRVFYDELQGFEDADIIKAFEISKKSKSYFALADLEETINAEIYRRSHRPEAPPKPEDCVPIEEVRKLINKLGEG